MPWICGCSLLNFVVAAVRKRAFFVFITLPPWQRRPGLVFHLLFQLFLGLARLPKRVEAEVTESDLDDLPFNVGLVGIWAWAPQLRWSLASRAGGKQSQNEDRNHWSAPLGD